MVDGVAVDGVAAPLALRAAEHLLRVEGDVDGEQAKAGRDALALHVVVDGASTHLEPAADAEHRPALGRAADDDVGDAGLAEPGEVAERGPRPGKDDEIGALDLAWVDGDDHPDARLLGQRVDVGGVRDAREADGGDDDAAVGVGGPVVTPAADLQRVLAVDPDAVQVGQDAEVGQPGAAGDVVEAGVEDGLVAAELVDDVAGEQRAVGVVEQRPGAVDRGEDAAAVDVADEHRREVELPCQAHVRVVALAEVDLCGRAGALADDQLVRGGQLLVGGVCGVGEVAARGGVLAGLQRPVRLAAEHDEGPPVRARLEQHRVEQRRRCDARRGRLKVLRAPDLRAVEAHHRVVAHVLRLERRDIDTAPPRHPAQPRDEQALARVRRRPRDQ